MEDKISEKEEWLVPLHIAEKLKEIDFDKLNNVLL